MNECFRLDKNSQKSPLQLVVCTAGMILLIASGTASAAPEDNSVRGVSPIAQASATIVTPTSLRAAELHNTELGFGRAFGLAVAPAAIVRRDCANDDAQQHCNLIILDLP